MDAVLTQIGNAAKVKIYTTGGSSSGTLLAEFSLPTPSGTVSGDTLTLDVDPDIDDASANNTGTAAVAEIHTSADVVKISGLTVGTSGTDVTISPSTSITSGQTVTLTALSIQHG
jgi:hypothetical protein